MKNLFKKEIIIKKNLKGLLVESAIGSIFVSIILYFCMTKYNSVIINSLNTINENNLALQSSFIICILVFIVISIMNIGLFTINTDTVKKSKRK